jgi:hypothetical protein
MSNLLGGNMNIDVNINLLDFFSKQEIEDTARKHNFVIRESPIDGFTMLLTFTIGLLETKNTTLIKLVTFLNNVSSNEVSPQALDKRISEAATNFLFECLEKVMSFSIKKVDINNELISNFSHIYIIDSSNFSLNKELKDDFKGFGGSASAATLRIQFIFDYMSGKIYLDIGDVKTTDAKTLEKIIDKNYLNTEGNALFLQDLGYYKLGTFEKIITTNNFFISKIKKNTKIFDLENNEIDFQKIMKSNNKIDMKVKICGVEFRLVGNKLSDDIANRKIREARIEAKKNGKTLSKRDIIFLSWGFYITNLSDEYSFETIYTLYRIRWQIELIFKCWKSILQMHTIQYVRKKERILCEIYGKLIVAIIISGHYYYLKSYYAEDFSYNKVLSFFSVIPTIWAMKIIMGKSEHKIFLVRLTNQILRFCKKNKQKNKLSIDILLSRLSKKEVRNNA